MSAVAVSARLNPPGPVTVTAAFVPAGSPVMVTLKAPVVAVHATANAAVTVSPAETVTVRGFCPCALQLAAKPPRRTVCWPGASASTVTLAFVPIAFGAAPSRRTVYPSGSAGAPVVAVVIVSEPVAGVQVTLNAPCVVSPAVTLTLRGLLPATVQLAATPLSSTGWLPGASPSTLAVPFAPIGWASPAVAAQAQPSGSWVGPLVVVVIAIRPVEGGRAVHVMTKATGAT